MATLKEINDLYKATFYLEDDVVLPFLVALVVGSKMKSPPVWAYLIGPSSGGKSELIGALAKVPFVSQISDLTVNTFLSGMGGAAGSKSPSLLTRLGPNFVVVMKDFTTILTKNEETQQAIIAQMREIYDGHIVKETGTGKTLEWGTKDRPNKATFIMASTEGIFKLQDQFAEMGTRAINYIMEPQDRMRTTRQALLNSGKIDEAKGRIQDMVKEFVMEKTANRPDRLPDIDEALQDEIIEVADFCALSRSSVARDFKGNKTLALSAEFPMRMAKQMMSIAQYLRYCNEGELPDEYRRVVFKVAFDSISKQRRIVIEALSQYPHAQVGAISKMVNYPTERVQEWIDDLNSFGIVEQAEYGGKNYWKLKERYYALMNRYRPQERKGDYLASDSSDQEDPIFAALAKSA